MKLEYRNMYQWNEPNFDAHQKWHNNKELWGHIPTLMVPVLREEFVAMTFGVRKILSDVSTLRWMLFLSKQHSIYDNPTPLKKIHMKVNASVRQFSTQKRA